MKIWKLLPHEQSNTIMLKDRDRYSHILRKHFIGYSMTTWWEPISFITSEKGKFNDFPESMPFGPAFSERLKEQVQSFLKDHIEWLPIQHPDQSYYIGNVLNVIDAVDYSRSKLRVPFGSFSGFAGFEKVCFKKELLLSQEHHIFKIPEFIQKQVFISDQFRELLINSKIKGFDFVEVWDSDITVEVDRQQEEVYEAFLTKLKKSEGTPYSWDQALEMVKSGKAMRSDVWKMQVNQGGEVLLAKLGRDCHFRSNNPFYVSPLLMQSTWYETEKSD